MGCDSCSEVKGDALDKKAFVLFVRALLFRLAPYEGVVVDGLNDEKSYVVWNRPETEEIVINENTDNLPVGSFIWMHDGEGNKN